MKRSKVVIFSLALGAGVLSALPASLAGWALSQTSGGKWSLVQQDGTVWQGSGQLAYQSQPGEWLPASRVAWSFQPAALFKMKLAWQLQADGSQGRVWLAPGRFGAQALALSLPLQALVSDSSPWQRAGLSGTVRLQLSELVRRNGQWQGEATLRCIGISAKISPVKPLGDYVLNANAAGEGFALMLSSGDGPLKLSGSGQWQAGTGLKLAGEAEAGAQQAQALQPVLLLLGREVTPGRVSWQVGS